MIDRARPIANLAKSHELYLRLLYAVYGVAFKGAALQQLVDQASRSPRNKKYAARFARGATQRHGEWMNANEERVKLQEQWQVFFDNFDVLLAPVMPTAAFSHDQKGSINQRTFVRQWREKALSRPIDVGGSGHRRASAIDRGPGRIHPRRPSRRSAGHRSLHGRSYDARLRPADG